MNFDSRFRQAKNYLSVITLIITLIRAQGWKIPRQNHSTPKRKLINLSKFVIFIFPPKRIHFRIPFSLQKWINFYSRLQQAQNYVTILALIRVQGWKIPRENNSTPERTVITSSNLLFSWTHLKIHFCISFSLQN